MTFGSHPKISDFGFAISDFQKSAVACATRATLANVKSSAMTARQPSVPNLICPITISDLQIRERGVVGVDDFSHSVHGHFQTTLAEQTCSGHESIRTGAGAFGGGLEIDAAVHADSILQI